MTQKSLVYVMLAVAVGYILVFTIPQQVAMYTTPQLTIRGEDGDIKPIPESSDSINGVDDLPPSMLGGADKGKETSFIEASQLPELLKWWTFDILIALTIYWIAKTRLS